MLRIGGNQTQGVINIIEDSNRIGIKKEPTGDYTLDTSGSINCGALFINGTRLGGGIHRFNRNANSDLLYKNNENLVIDTQLDVSNSVTLNDTLDVFKNTTFNSSLFVNNNISISGDINISDNNILFNGKPNVSHSVKIQDTLDVSNTATFHSSLFISKDVSMGGTVTVEDTLDVSNTATLHSSLFVSKDISMGGNLLINGGDVYLNEGGLLNVSGAVTFEDNLDVSNDVTFHSSLFVSKDVSLGGAVILEDTLDVSNHVTLQSSLFVSKDVSMGGTVTFEDTLDVSNDVTFHSSLFVNKDVSMGDIVTIDNTLDVSNAVTFHSSLFVNNDISMGGDVTIAETMNVARTVIFEDNLDVSNDVTFHSSLFVSKDVSIGDVVTIGDTLDVSNDVTLQSSLFVSKDVSMGGTVTFEDTLDVSNDVTFHSSLFVSKDVSMCDIVTIDDTMDVSNTATFHSSLIVNNDVSIGGTWTYGEILNVPGTVTFEDTLDVSNDVIFHSSLFVSKDVSMGGIVTLEDTLDVSNDVTLQSSLFVSKDVSMGGTVTFEDILDVSNDVTFHSSLFVSKDVSMGNNVSIDDTLDVSNTTTFHSSLFVNNDVSIGGTWTYGEMLNVPGTVTFEDTLDVSNDVIFHSSLFVSKDVSMGGIVTLEDTLDVSNDVTLQSSLFVSKDVSMGGTVTFEDTLDVSNDVTFHSSLFVNKDVSMGGAVTIDDTLDVSNIVTFHSSLFVNNDVSMGGDVTIEATLDVSNAAMFHSTLFVSNDVSMNGNLMVEGNALNYGNMEVKGAVTIDNILDVSNDVTLQSSLFVSKDVSMGGTVTLEDTLDVSNDSTFHSSLFVSEDISIGSTVTLEDTLDVSNVVTFHSNLFVNKDVTLNSSLLVKNDVSMGGALVIDDTLDVSNSVTFHSVLFVGNDVSMEKNINVEENVFIGGDLDVSNSVILENTLDVCNNVTFHSSLFVTEDVSINSNLAVSKGNVVVGEVLEVSDAVTFYNTLDVCNNVTFHSSLFVNNDVSMEKNVNAKKNVFIGGDLDVSDAVTLMDTLDVCNNVTFRSALLVINDVSMQKNLNVKENLFISGELDVRNAVTLGNTLDVSNNVTFHSSLIVNEDVSMFGDLTVSKGNVFVGEVLEVSDAVIFYDTLDVCNNVTFYSSLFANNDVSVGGNATFENTLDVSNTATFHSSIFVNNDISVNGDIFITTGKLNTQRMKLHSDVILGNILEVSNNTTFHSSLFVNNDISMGGNLIVSNGGLYVGGVLDVDSSLSIPDILDVSNASTLHSSLFVSNDVSIDGSFMIDKTLDISNSSTLHSLLFVNSDISLGGNLNLLNGTLSVSSIELDDSVIFPVTLNVINAVTLNSSLYVSKDISINENVVIKDILDVPNATTFHSSLLVSKDISMGGAVAISDILNVDNSSIFHSSLVVSDDVSMDDHVIVDGTLDVSSAVTLHSTLFVSNDISMENDIIIEGSIFDCGTIEISGAASVNDTLDVSNSVTFNSTLFVSKNITIDDTLDIYDSSKFNSSLVVNKDVSVGGTMTINETLDVSNATTFHSSLFVNNDVSMGGDVTIGATLDVSNAVTFHSTLFVPNDISMENDIIIEGSIFDCGTIEISGAASVNDTLDVSNSVTFNSTLFVSKNITIDDTLDIYDSSKFNSSLVVNKDVSVGGTMTINETLDVSNATTFHSSLFVNNDISMGGDVTIGATLDVSNAVTFHSTLFVSNDVSMNGNLMVEGNVLNFENMEVDGSVTINDTLVVSNAITLNSSLVVSKDVSMGEAVTIDDTLDVSNATTFHSSLFVNNDVSMEGDVIIGNTLIVSNEVTFNSLLFVSDDISMDSNLTLSNGNMFIDGYLGDISSIKSIPYNLDVSNNATLYSSLVVSDDVSMGGIVSIGGTLDVSNAVTLHSSLVVSDDVSMGKSITIGDTLDLSNAATFHSSLIVKEDVILKGFLDHGDTLTISGDTFFNSNLFFEDEVVSNALLIMNGGELRIDPNNVQARSAIFESTMEVNTDLGNSASSLRGTLYVYGDVSINALNMNGGNIKINGGLKIPKEITDVTNPNLVPHAEIAKYDTANSITVVLPNSLDVYGNVAVDSVVVINDISMGGNFIVNGVKKSNSTNRLIVSDVVRLENTLDVYNNVTFHSSLFVNNDISMGGNLVLSEGDLYISGVLDVGSSFSISDILDIFNTTKFHSSLFISNDVSVGGYFMIDNTLDVFNVTTFKSSLFVVNDSSMGGNIIMNGGDLFINNMYVRDPLIFSDTLDVSNAVTLHSSLNVSNDISMDGDIIMKNSIFNNILTFDISVNEDKLIIDNEISPNLTFIRGFVYKFDQSIITNIHKPISFLNISREFYTDGLTRNNLLLPPDVIYETTLIVPQDSPSELIYAILDVSSGEWNQQGDIIHGTDITESQFGYTVSLSSDGSILAVGMNSQDGEFGHVRIYKWNDISWGQLGDAIYGNEKNTDLDDHGISVSLNNDGTVIAIGTRKSKFIDETQNAMASDAGDVKIYYWNDVSWNQRGDTIHGNGREFLGSVVSLSSDGTIVAIAAPGYETQWSRDFQGLPNPNNQHDKKGLVRIYQWNNVSWDRLGSDIVEDSTNGIHSFGYSISLSSDGTILAVGAPFPGETGAGNVYVYKWNDISWNRYGSGDLKGDIDDPGDAFGLSVSLNSDGSIIAIGAPRRSYGSYVRVYNLIDNSWYQVGNDISNNIDISYQYSGFSVSLNSFGNILSIGSIMANDYNSYRTGSVNVYHWFETSESWIQPGTDISDIQSGNDNFLGSFFGYANSLSSDGSILAIGAPTKNKVTENDGIVKVYSFKYDYYSQNSIRIMDLLEVTSNSTIAVSYENLIINKELDVRNYIKVPIRSSDISSVYFEGYIRYNNVINEYQGYDMDNNMWKTLRNDWIFNNIYKSIYYDGGDVSIDSGNLKVYENIRIEGLLIYNDISNDISFINLSTSLLNIHNTATIGSGTIATLSTDGGIQIDGTLDVSSAVTFNSLLTVSNDLYIGGDLSGTGNLYFNTLYTDSITINNVLDISNAVTLHSLTLTKFNIEDMTPFILDNSSTPFINNNYSTFEAEVNDKLVFSIPDEAAYSIYFVDSNGLTNFNAIKIVEDSSIFTVVPTVADPLFMVNRDTTNLLYYSFENMTGEETTGNQSNLLVSQDVVSYGGGPFGGNGDSGATWLNHDGTIVVSSAVRGHAPSGTPGAPGFTFGSRNSNLAGIVIAWKYDGSTWNQYGQTLYGKGNSHHFGWRVALNAEGNILAATSYQGSGVHVYEYDDSTNTWIQLGETDLGSIPRTLIPGIGWSLAISKDSNYDEIIVASTTTQLTTVYVWEYNRADNTFNRIGEPEVDSVELANSFSGGHPGGLAMSRDGKTIAIGHPYEQMYHNGYGLVHVMKYNDQTGKWYKLGQSMDPGQGGGAAFNSISLSSDGKILSFGSRHGVAHGKFWTYHYDDAADPYTANINRSTRSAVTNVSYSSWIDLLHPGVGTWHMAHHYDDAITTPHTGSTSCQMSDDGKTIVAGLFASDGAHTVRVYNWSSSGGRIGEGIWQQAPVLLLEGQTSGPDGYDVNNVTTYYNDYFGRSVAMSGDGNFFAAAAPHYNGTRNNMGIIRVVKITKHYDTAGIEELDWLTFASNPRNTSILSNGDLQINGTLTAGPLDLSSVLIFNSPIFLLDDLYIGGDIDSNTISTMTINGIIDVSSIITFNSSFLLYSATTFSSLYVSSAVTFNTSLTVSERRHIDGDANITGSTYANFLNNNSLTIDNTLDVSNASTIHSLTILPSTDSTDYIIVLDNHSPPSFNNGDDISLFIRIPKTITVPNNAASSMRIVTNTTNDPMETVDDIITVVDDSTLTILSTNYDSLYLINKDLITRSPLVEKSIVFGEVDGEEFSQSVTINRDGTIIAVGAWMPQTEPRSHHAQAQATVSVTRVYNYDITRDYNTKGDLAGGGGQLGQDILGPEILPNAGRSFPVGGGPLGYVTTTSFTIKYSTQSSTTSLSDDGYIIAIGTWCWNNWQGKVQVYQYNSTNNQWNQIGQDLVGNEEYVQFGYNVVLSSDGTVVAIGAPYYPSPTAVTENAITGLSNYITQGAVYVYEYNGSSWILRGRDARYSEIETSIRGVDDYEDFGRSIAMNSDGTIVAVAAPRRDIDPSGGAELYGDYNYRGYFAVFQYDSSDSIWNMLGEEVAGPEIDSFFGRTTIAISDNGMIVACSDTESDVDFESRNGGMVAVYQYNGIDNWVQLGDIIYGTVAMRFGWEIQLRGDGTIMAFTGGGRDNYPASLHLKYWDGSAWNTIGDMLPSSGYSGKFKNAFAMSRDGSIILVGAPGVGGRGGTVGRLWIYNYSESYNSSDAVQVSTFLPSSSFAYIDGDVQTDGTLEVFEATTFNSNVSINSSLTISGTLNTELLSESSDDRVKHNEEDISGLYFISQLNPQKYLKTRMMYEENYLLTFDNSNNYTNIKEGDKVSEEIGFIAQDILKIPELSFCVTDSTPYSLKYNNLFVLTIKAIIEFKHEIDALQTELTDLKTLLQSKELLD